MNLRNNDGLCHTCSKVDLHSLLKGRTKYTTLENEFDQFWDLPKVVQERNCPLCRLLIRCFRTSEGFNFEEVGKFDRICGVYAGRELQLSIHRKDGLTRSSYSIQSCATEDNKIREQLEEIKPTCFDVGELKSWLNRCSNEHQQCKPKGGLSGKPLPRGFRLIDVERGCIVSAESCLVYCALSYVWGSVDQLVLKKYNLMELEEEYALFGDKFILPKTITDAIKLCQDIGQKYLWVDCLCILQDEEEEKHNQIGSMDAVYNLAFLTIIAAAGDNANAGLSPSISPRLMLDRSIYVESISGNNILSSLSPILAAESITGSKWATRGWTLQEYVLSKRIVIFSGKHVFFRCEEALWGEDFGLQLSSFCENWPGWDLPLYRFSSISHSVSRHYSDIYPRLAAQYIRRVLTNEEDILDAFLGILHRLEANIGPHLWGMPSKEFGSALLWSTSNSFAIRKRPSFPSWSWAGWIHITIVPFRKDDRDDMYYGLDSWVTNTSILKCFKLGDDGKLQCFEDNNIDRVFQIQRQGIRENKISASSSLLIEKAIERHFTPPSDYEQILDSYISVKTGSAPLVSQYVFFWTSCATLRVDRQPKSVQTYGLKIGEYIIYQGSEAFGSVGSAYLDVAWREKQPEMLEFAVTTVGLKCPIFPSGEIIVELGLMLIESCGDTALKTYTKVPGTRATIEQQYWSEAKPQQRLLALL